MKNVVLAVATNRPIPAPTLDSLRALVEAGARQIMVQGSSDVAFARNVQLSSAVALLRKDPSLDVVLLVDDDMTFNLGQAMEVCEHAIRSGTPASAVYPTVTADLAASTEWSPFPGRWLVGLGFLAIPRARLLELADRSPAFTWRNEEFYEFTNSALHPIDVDGVPVLRWLGEDYWFCIRLGGVDLLPVAVGHLKMIPICADEETLAKIRAGEPLVAGGVRGGKYSVETGQGSGLKVKQP